MITKEGVLIIGLIMGFIIGLAVMDIYSHSKVQIKTESFRMDMSFKEFSSKDKILCEEGVQIVKYYGLHKQVVYGCLDLINGSCAGAGKLCIRQYK